MYLSTIEQMSAHTERDHFSPYGVIGFMARLHLELHMESCHTSYLKGLLGWQQWWKGWVWYRFRRKKWGESV